MDLTIFQYFILGLIQGITEWIPLSSSGILTLIISNFFNITNLEKILSKVLLLHLGTFFSALFYFRKDVKKLTKSFFNYKKSKQEEKKILNFIFISTIVSGLIGIFILLFLKNQNFELTGKTISFIVGFFLLLTGIFQVKIKQKGLKKEIDLEKKDSFFLGIAQGFSAFPGISRSGITISALLLKKFDDSSSLRLSFLMSLPIIFFGNIIINYKELFFSINSLVGIFSSFIFGLLTIHIMMKVSKKINFGWFVIIFAFLMMASFFI